MPIGSFRTSLIDVVAVVAGSVLAVPFLLLLAAPFVGGI